MMLSKTFRESMSIKSSVLEAGDKLFKFLLFGLWSWSVKLASTSLDRQICWDVFVPNGTFELFEETSVDQLLTFLFSISPFRNFSSDICLQSIVQSASCK